MSTNSHTRPKEVRRKLNEFVRTFIADADQAIRHNAFLELAGAGAELRHHLFHAVEDQANAQKIQGWLRNDWDEPPTIVFRVRPRIHIPWGLIFDMDGRLEGGDSARLDIETFGGFWAVKYRASATYFRITPAGLNNALSADDATLIPVVNREVSDAVSDALTDAECVAVDAVLTCKGDLINTKKELADRWVAALDAPAIVYFLCHANETSVALSRNEGISHFDWASTFHRSSETGGGATVVVLNGCNTAVGSEKGGFLEVTGSDGFCGFIGTEADLPDLFGHRFGAELLRRLLCSGEPVLDIMQTMRREHWPLSILYAVYCYRNLQFRPLHAQLPPLKSENYAVKPLAARTLRPQAVIDKGGDRHD